MLLQNNFFAIQATHTEAQRIVASCTIDPEHAIFEGHFPKQPVVPGVCMVQMIKEILEQGIGKKLFLRAASQLKFLQLLVPQKGAIITADLSWKTDDENRYILTASLLYEEKAVMKMNAHFTEM
ncbi:3-hydroxyacyl-ACP dehydratase [Taibaiella sp. KBW10]|uniref:3-hydroxyacyl-ACP dehydratase n=1 Tax=Taibaiella sp. KBW10 TaxID=2153357 RepID=UPI000F5AF2B0|nr:3-hydroxyacyl-ACP dehydratase [Taibaiella sp. KBW10]RQO31606.1 3-hydroxyacyl-ACP dehydratase [Taibaiella sp. KBW10]